MTFSPCENVKPHTVKVLLIVTLLILIYETILFAGRSQPVEKLVEGSVYFRVLQLTHRGHYCQNCVNLLQ